jgi:hypothetical protein
MKQLAFGAFYRPDEAPISGLSSESWAASASGAAAVDPTWTPGGCSRFGGR